MPLLHTSQLQQRATHYDHNSTSGAAPHSGNDLSILQSAPLMNLNGDRQTQAQVQTQTQAQAQQAQRQAQQIQTQTQQTNVQHAPRSYQQVHNLQRAASTSVSVGNVNRVSRNAAVSLMSSPRQGRRVKGHVVTDSQQGFVLPMAMAYDNSSNNGNSSDDNNNSNDDLEDQAPQMPTRSGMTMRTKGTSPTPTSTSTTNRQTAAQKQPQKLTRQAPGRSKSSSSSYSKGLPQTWQDIAGNNNNNNINNNSNNNHNNNNSNTIKQPKRVAHLRQRKNGTSSDDEQFDPCQNKFKTFDNENGNGNGESFYLNTRNKLRNSEENDYEYGNNCDSSYQSRGGCRWKRSVNGNSSSREHPGPNSNRWGSGILCQQQLIKLSRMKLGHLLQVVIVLSVIALVYESHHKALFATQQLTQFKDEESLLLLHLQKIEQQSIQLHENLGRLTQAHIEGGSNNNNNNNYRESNKSSKHSKNKRSQNNSENDDGSGDGNNVREIDFDLIHKQTQQLYQMEEELSHEVLTLQKRIQLSARNHIIQEFGEGPVQVVLEVDFGDNSGNDNAGPYKISILLWHDTPHAAWTWLEQIGHNVWDGAELSWQKGNVIDAIPSQDKLNHNDNNDSGNSHYQHDGKIEFVEQSQHSHQAWTVGVREHPIHNEDGAGRSSLGMYINLQDNSKLHKHETCVGKITDGFDVLQKILEAARTKNNNSNGKGDLSSIVVRKATAMHYVTKKPGMG